MRRSMFDASLQHLEPIEFGRIEVAPRNLGGAIITAACESIPVTHQNQYEAAREWLATITPDDREPGWLARYAESLLAAR